jgi:hypothetical protein
MRKTPLLLVATVICAIAAAGNAEPAPAPAKPGFTLADLKAQFQQTKDGAFLMEVPQILNTATDREVQPLLTGQAVETTGQLLRDPAENADGSRLRIFRAEFLCCSEHARQCSVALEFENNAPSLKANTWVRLNGTIAYRSEGGKTVPVIRLKTISESAKPAKPTLP